MVDGCIWWGGDLPRRFGETDYGLPSLITHIEVPDPIDTFYD